MAARKLLAVSFGIAAATMACSDDKTVVGNAMNCPCGPQYDTGSYDSTFRPDAADADSSVDANDADATSDSLSTEAADGEVDVDGEDAKDTD